MLRLKNVKIVLTIFFVGFSGLFSLKSSIIEVKSNGVNYDIYFYDYPLIMDSRYKSDLMKSTKHIAKKSEYDDEDLNYLKLISEYYNKKNLLQDLKNKYEKTHKHVLSGANQLKGVYKFFTDKIDLLSTKVCKENKKQAMIRDIETIIIDELNKIDPNMVSQNSIRAKIDYLVMKRSYNIDSSDNPDDYEYAIKGEEELSKLMKNLYLNVRNTIFAKYQLKY